MNRLGDYDDANEDEGVSKHDWVMKAVRLPPAHIEKAQMIAAANGITFSQWMREVVAKELGLD